jgi:MFS family permease
VARRDLVILSMYQLLANNRSGLFLVYFPLFLVAAKGASVPVALAFVSLAYVAASLLGPVAGRLSDRIGRRRPFLLVAEVGAFPLFLSIPYLPTYWDAGVVFLLAQVVLSLGSPALNAYVADITGAGERGAGFGLLNATGWAGAVAGFAISAVLIELFGFDALFWFVAAVMVGTIGIVVLFVPDRAVPRSPARQPWREYRGLAIFSVAVSIRALGWGAVGTFIGVLAFELGANPLEIAGIAVAGLAAAAVTALPGGRLIDRRGEISGIWYGTLLTLAGIGVYFVASTWIVLVPAQVLRYIGFALLSPGMMAYVANRAPATHRAEHLGVFALINSTFWSLGPFAGGIAIAVAGNAGLFAFAIGCTLVSLAAIELLYQTRARRDRRSGDLALGPQVLTSSEAPPAST